MAVKQSYREKIGYILETSPDEADVKHTIWAVSDYGITVPSKWTTNGYINMVAHLLLALPYADAQHNHALGMGHLHTLYLGETEYDLSNTKRETLVAHLTQLYNDVKGRDPWYATHG